MKWFLTLSALLFASLVFGNTETNKKPNILFLAVDDWNDWVGCLGADRVSTPNMDRLAAKGVLFTKAYTASPLCNPSRTAIMSGLRPSTTGVYENAQPGPACVPEGHKMLPEYFRDHGYYTVGSGKIYHDWVGMTSPKEWDEYYLWNEIGRQYGWFMNYSLHPCPLPETRPANEITKKTKRNFDWAALDYPEEAWPDHRCASYAVKFLEEKHDKPFFLAVGMFRPHIPWFAPEKYFDQYPLDEIETPPYLERDTNDIPDPAKKLALTSASKHYLVKEYGEWEKAIQAYQACISFSDAQIGRVLDALENSPHHENTIIILWSDHGYHLGEKDHWHKRTLWERATHIPLIVVAPGVTSAGKECNQPVDLMSVYPTLLELAGLPAYESIKGEGESLVPLLKDPKNKLERPALMTYGYNNHAVRSQNFRYIRYADGSEELYDHGKDPNEWNNLAHNIKYKKVIDEHRKWLPENNRKPGPSYYKGEVLFNPETFEWKLKEAVKGNPDFIHALDLKKECIEKSAKIIEWWMPDGYKPSKY